MDEKNFIIFATHKNMLDWRQDLLLSLSYFKLETRLILYSENYLEFKCGIITEVILERLGKFAMIFWVWSFEISNWNSREKRLWIGLIASQVYSTLKQVQKFNLVKRNGGFSTNNTVKIDKKPKWQANTVNSGQRNA